MSQLSHDSFAPTPFAPAHSHSHSQFPQHHPPPPPPQGNNQAFAYPGQQHFFHDAAASRPQQQQQQQQQPTPTGAGMMHMQPQPTPYTTAPYAQSIPAQARQSASPTHHFSPNAGSQGQPNSQTPPTKFPMAAPPLPQTPANPQLQQQASTSTNVASPKSPQSPGSQSREQQRCALLLSINMELLKEVNRLQEAGQGGAINPQQQQQLKNAGQNDKMASEEYIQCLRRVQANLAYMMPKAGQQNDKAPPGPAHMTPPTHLPQLKDRYDQLRELFPEWQGLDSRLAGSSASPRPNAQGGNNSANGVNA